MKTNKSYTERLEKLIPGGAHTYSRGSDQFPTNAPSILSKGKGAYVWSFDNSKFLDYGMGLRSVTLGYSNKEINESVIKELKKGNNLTRPSLTELEAAEKIIDLLPNAEMVKFAKNGSNVTTAAVKLARAYTGKNKICVPIEQPFFSFDDWFIGSTKIKKGIPNEISRLTRHFNYGNIESLEKIFSEDNDIAAVILEPATTVMPCNKKCLAKLNYNSCCHNLVCEEQNFLKKVEILCKKNNTLFILDEMITGFRFHLKGAQHLFNVKPDLSTFGKGMANGYSLAALVGKKEIMDFGSINKTGMERTFLLSTTHGAEMISLRAFIKTTELYKKHDICNHLWEYGAKLKKLINEITVFYDINQFFKLEGLPILMNYLTLNQGGENDMKLRTLFNQEMIKNKVFMPWIAQSFAHNEKELLITEKALYNTFKVLKKAIEEGPEKFLIDDKIIKPVFRKYN